MSEKDEQKRQQQKKKHKFTPQQIIVLLVILGLGGYALSLGINEQKSENRVSQSAASHSSNDDDEDYDDSGDDDSDYDSDDDEDYDSSSTDDESDDDTSPFEGSKFKDKIGEKIAETMQSNFDAGIVKYDKSQGTVMVIPTDPDFVMAAADIATGASDTGDWDEMTGNFDELSETIYDKYHSHIPLAIVNPKNTDKVLYETIDGSTVYDFAHDGSN